MYRYLERCPKYKWMPILVVSILKGIFIIVIKKLEGKCGGITAENWKTYILFQYMAVFWYYFCKIILCREYWKYVYVYVRLFLIGWTHLLINVTTWIHIQECSLRKQFVAISVSSLDFLNCQPPLPFFKFHIYSVLGDLGIFPS